MTQVSRNGRLALASLAGVAAILVFVLIYPFHAIGPIGGKSRPAPVPSATTSVQPGTPGPTLTPVPVLTVVPQPTVLLVPGGSSTTVREKTVKPQPAKTQKPSEEPSEEPSASPSPSPSQRGLVGDILCRTRVC